VAKTTAGPWYCAAGIFDPALLYTKPSTKLFTFAITSMSQEKTQKGSLQGGKVNNSIDDYNKLHEASLETRESKYAKLVNAYYDLAAIFYEWGWGQSFHFAIKKKGETFYSSLFRHEKTLSDTLGLKKNDEVLDCGCGVGGPYRTIAKHSGANITGVTIDASPLKEQQTRRRRRRRATPPRRPPPLAALPPSAAPPPRAKKQRTPSIARPRFSYYAIPQAPCLYTASQKGVYTVELVVGRAASHHLSQHDRSYRV
jgi:hypothetical protein